MEELNESKAFINTTMKEAKDFAESVRGHEALALVYNRMSNIPYGDKLVRFLKTVPSMALCGGVIRSLLEGNTPKDWDFYLPEKDMKNVLTILQGYPSITIEKQNSKVINATWLSVDDVEDGKVSSTSMQFLAIRNNLPAYKQPLRFDLTPTLFSLRYDSTVDDYVLYQHLKAVPSIINKTMELFNFTDPYHTLGRIGRYTTYGYRLVTSEAKMLALGLAINTQNLLEFSDGEYDF